MIYSEPAYEKIIIALFLCIVCFTSCDEIQIKKLKKEGVVGKAKITDCNIRSKGSGVILDYTFTVAGKKIKGKQSYYELKSQVCSELFYKEVSIIYIADDPEVNRLMVSENDFKKLGYPYPDSLKWTESYHVEW